MESPVVVDKPPEYGTARSNDRGFPFDEEEGSGAWSELASRHPDIAARLRARPQTWARKRRPSSQDQPDDFGDEFGGFDRFPFDDIPPEFREHFPSHFGRRFTTDQGQPSQPQSPPKGQPQSPQPQQQTTSTQTEQPPGPSTLDPQAFLPQYGLRNTVDLGQKSPVDPSVDADDRTQRSVSAPPETPNQPTNKMSGQSPPQHEQHPSEQPSNVRHIPIFVEGRDEPVINKNVDHGAHYAEPKPTYAPPPPHVDREQYFADDSPAGFHHPPNFGRAFGTPFNKGFRQGPQPFVQQKAYPQAAQFARGASPARSQSPKPPPHEEHFVKVPVHHEHAAPKPEQPPSRAQPKPQQQPPPPPPPPPQQAPPQQAPPQPKPQPSPNDPINQILSIQTDVLNLMSEVENFTGSKKDKRYLFLDEMLTRNLIKLDNIETDGKENIRQARKEAIRCIQKCIAVLEAKAEKGSAALNEEMKEGEQKNAENGEVEMKETKEEAQPTADAKEEQKQETEVNKEIQAVDTRTEPEKTEATPEVKPENKPATEEKSSPKKKVVKKRDKSKDKDAAKDSNKAENVDNKDKKNEEMQVDEKGDKEQSGNSQMEVDGASASQ